MKLITKILEYNANKKIGHAKLVGHNIKTYGRIILKNPQYMSIGDDCFFGEGCRIEAWDYYNTEKFYPEIIIGNRVKINSTCHIGAINKIVIGDGCLLGSHVLIIDHSHGRNSAEEMLIEPSDRDLYSKGSIIIGKRCWICDNVTILPNVHIGDNCTIGANAVVSKDIPSNSVAVGNPAHVVKQLKNT